MARSVKCYRVCEVRDGEFLSLFHGTGGSRVLPVGKWLTADKKLVRDGTGYAYYESGFHVFLTYVSAVEFFKKKLFYHEGRVIVEVRATGLRKKNGHSHVLLAERMKVVGPVEMEA